MKQEKYILFLKTMRGYDGYKYIAKVKYKIKDETPVALYLPGKVKMKYNKLLKSRISDSYVIGNIIRDCG